MLALRLVTDLGRVNIFLRLERMSLITITNDCSQTMRELNMRDCINFTVSLLTLPYYLLAVLLDFMFFERLHPFALFAFVGIL